MKIDWQELAENLDCVSKAESHHAFQALSVIIGQGEVESAIDHYLEGLPGSRLVQAILCEIRPRSGMEYCYKVFKTDPDSLRRSLAVSLLSEFGDESTLNWVQQFLDDQDWDIQVSGAALVDQLLMFRYIIEADCEFLIERIQRHQNSDVRRYYRYINASISRGKSEEDDPGRVPAERTPLTMSKGVRKAKRISSSYRGGEIHLYIEFPTVSKGEQRFNCFTGAGGFGESFRRDPVLIELLTGAIGGVNSISPARGFPEDASDNLKEAFRTSQRHLRGEASYLNSLNIQWLIRQHGLVASDLSPEFQAVLEALHRLTECYGNDCRLVFWLCEAAHDSCAG